MFCSGEYSKMSHCEIILQQPGPSFPCSRSTGENGYGSVLFLCWHTHLHNIISMIEFVVPTMPILSRPVDEHRRIHVCASWHMRENALLESQSVLAWVLWSSNFGPSVYRLNLKSMSLQNGQFFLKRPSSQETEIKRLSNMLHIVFWTHLCICKVCSYASLSVCPSVHDLTKIQTRS